MNDNTPAEASTADASAPDVSTAEEETADRPIGEDADTSRTQGGPSAVLKGDLGFREPPEDFVSAAKVAPNHWLSVIDRHWEAEEGESPPSWATLGRWRSDEQGEIVEWEENTEYRPSPDAYGWAGPVSTADAAVRLVATGYGSQELFAMALADSDVAVCVEEDGALTVTEAPEGTAAVPVFSPSPKLEDDKLPPHEVMLVPDLLDRMPEGKDVLFLSSSAPVGQLITVSELRSALADLDRYDLEPPEDPWPQPLAAGDRPDLFTDLPDLGTVGDWPDLMPAEEPPGAAGTAEDGTGNGPGTQRERTEPGRPEEV
jgi:hypothetical protein